MLPGGHLTGALRDPKGKNPLIADQRPENTADFSPWHDTVELVELNWEGNIVWSFTGYDDDGTGVMMSRQHHDYQCQGNPVGYYAPGQAFVENGNTLILAHLNKQVPRISHKPIVDDVIYEVDANGNLTGYEWHGADELIGSLLNGCLEIQAAMPLGKP
jgi:hypothetical protein